MENKAWTIPGLLQFSGEYWGICTLHTGIKLGIFTHMAEEGTTAPALAERLGLDPRGLAMLLNALTAMNLIEKKGNLYFSTPFAAKHLSKASPDYLGHIIMHHHHLMESWVHLDEAVASGKPVRRRDSLSTDAQARESFEMGMFNLAMQMAPHIVPHIDLGGRRRLLDLGGGPGTYAIHFCLQNPELAAVVVDLPTTRPFAEKTICRFGLSGRVTFADGDFIAREIEGRYDVAWLSHILHGEGPEGCAVTLERAVAALEPGGLLLVQEFILNDTQDGPPFPALFSLNMLLGTPHGQAYAEGELKDMLTAAGLRDVRRIHLELSNGAGIIAGTVPN